LSYACGLLKLFWSFLVLLVIALGTSFVHAADTPANALLVLAKHDGTRAIVDPSSLQVIARIPVGTDPHEVIVSSDGKTAYVSNHGFGAYNTLAVVDLVGQKAWPAVDLGALRGPHGLTFVGGKAWFIAEGAKAVGRYDPASKSVDWILGTGQNRTHMSYVSPNMKLIVTTNVSSGTVNIIEKTDVSVAGQGRPLDLPGRDWNETVVEVGNGSEGFDVSADGKAGDGTVSIIDIASQRVTQTHAADIGGAKRLKVYSRRKACTDFGFARIRSHRYRYCQAENRPANRCRTRRRRHRYATGWCACIRRMSPDNYVVVIDQHSMKVVGRIEVGQDPDGLAWAARSGTCESHR
jgi:hypothetical protein